MRVVGHLDAAVGWLAQEAVTRNRTELIVDGHHATVQGSLVAKHFTGVFELCVTVEPPGEGRGHNLPLGMHKVTKTVTILDGHIEPVRKVLAYRTRAVKSATLEAIAAHITFNGIC